MLRNDSLEPNTELKDKQRQTKAENQQLEEPNQCEKGSNKLGNGPVYMLQAWWGKMGNRWVGGRGRSGDGTDREGVSAGQTGSELTGELYFLLYSWVSGLTCAALIQFTVYTCIYCKRQCAYLWWMSHLLTKKKKKSMVNEWIMHRRI